MKRRLIGFLALISLASSFQPLQSRSKSSRLFQQQKGDNANSSLGRNLEGLQEAVALKETVEPGDTVVCKLELPSSGFYTDEAYEVKAIFGQRFDPETQTMDKISLPSLDAPVPRGYDRYVTLYNPSFQDAAVVVTPEEVGLVSVRTEVFNAMWLAIPGFFWLFVATSFYNVYHERTGGSFVDALLGK